MCIAVPAKVIEIKDNIATTDVMGVKQRVACDFCSNLKIGDYVLVHGGYIIEVLDEESALESIELFRELAEMSIKN